MRAQGHDERIRFLFIAGAQIMNRKEYKEYQETIAYFFETEGIRNLSPTNMEDEPYFSSSSCDCCNRSLGGDRYQCSRYNAEHDTIVEDYEICPDCYYYAEYGQLDDMTMQEIEDSEKDLDRYKVNPYAWPGGYNVLALMADGETLCHDCICNEKEVFQDDTLHDQDGWRFVGSDVYWEGPIIYCAHCNKALDSEYGDPEEDQ